MQIDYDKLRANVEDTALLLTSDPASGHVRPRVSTRLVGDVQAISEFVQYDKPFTFRCDEAESRAGKGEAPSPLRYLLSSIAFCQQVWYAKAAALVGAEIENLAIDVHTYMDMRGEHKVGETPPYPQWIVTEAAITSPSPSDLILAMVDEATSRCPVTTLLARAVPMYERIVLNDNTIRDTVPDGLDR